MNRIPVLFSVLILGLICRAADAQPEPRKEVLTTAEPIPHPIHITYYPATPDANPAGVRNASVVVFLHSDNESRLKWDKDSGPRGNAPFPVELQARGYAAITVDLRKHGDSKIAGREDEMIQPVDYERMVLADLVAVKKFIRDEHQNQKLNMRKMAIVASGMSAAVAARFAEQDWNLPYFDDHAVPAMRTPRGQDVRALVFLSPHAAAGRVRTGPAMNSLKDPAKGIALQVIVGNDDAANRRTADQLYRPFSANPQNAERVEIVKPASKDQGIALMTKNIQDAYLPLLKFLDKHVKTLDDEWVDRRSRLER